MAEKQETKQMPKHFKEYILKSQKYANRKDALHIILEEDKPYTLAEVDQLLEDFMKGKVKA